MALIQAGLLMNVNVLHFNDILLKEKLSINPIIVRPPPLWISVLYSKHLQTTNCLKLLNFSKLPTPLFYRVKRVKTRPKMADVNHPGFNILACMVCELSTVSDTIS